MDWFEELVGFPEASGDEIRQRLDWNGEWLSCKESGNQWHAGTFSTPSLSELRSEVAVYANETATRIREVVADVRDLHLDPQNRHAVFQVASQFNCLEMVSPEVTPEQGVGCYDQDFTQGPTCAICAGAGTIVRNYFVEVGGCRGQSKSLQVDCLRELAVHWENERHRHWEMKNGYCLPSPQGLQWIEGRLCEMDEDEFNRLRGLLRVGVQEATQVTLEGGDHEVTQVFCSALPMAYSDVPSSAWVRFPQLILDAAYEATFKIAIQNVLRTGCRKLFLTLIGGGVFGNPLDLILAAVARSLRLHKEAGLDVQIVSHGHSRRQITEFVSSVSG